MLLVNSDKSISITRISLTLILCQFPNCEGVEGGRRFEVFRKDYPLEHLIIYHNKVAHKDHALCLYNLNNLIDPPISPLFY